MFRHRVDACLRCSGCGAHCSDGFQKARRRQSRGESVGQMASCPSCNATRRWLLFLPMGALFGWSSSGATRAQPRAIMPPTEHLPTRGRHHRMPDVFIIGAAKSGTSTLASRLNNHPAIFLRNKEPEFFSHDQNFRRGLDWYCQNFAQARPDQLCLDASTGYTRAPQYPRAAQRIFHYCPQAKLIYLMRHPVERAFAHYVHRFTKELFPGRPLDRSFEEHIAADPVCVDSSDYRLQLEMYLEHFEANAILPIFTSDLQQDESATLRKVADFLGLDLAPLAGATPTAENTRAQFTEGRVRTYIAERIKAVPGLGHAVRTLPRPLKEFGFRALRRVGAGRKVEQALEPRPMQATTRQALIERFAPGNQWLSTLAGPPPLNWFT